MTRPVLRLVGALAAAVLIAIVYGVWGTGTSEQAPGSLAPDDVARVEEPAAEREVVALPEREPAPEVVERVEPVEQVEPSRPLTPQAPGQGPDWPPDELLASLDLLESWDLLNTDDLDLALASLDAVDELLLDMEGI